MELSNLLSFLVALTLAGQALRGLANLQTVIAEGLAAAERLFAALDVEPEIRDAPDAADLPRGEATIRLRGRALRLRRRARRRWPA